MKNILKITVALILVSGFITANAQTPHDTLKKTLLAPKLVNASMEYVFVKNNLVLVHRDNKDAALSGTFTCTDGSTVDADGIFIRKDGTKLQLNNGDKVIKDGRFMLAPK